MISVTTYQPLEKGKIKLGFDNGMEVTVYGSEIRSLRLKEEAIVTEEDYHRLIYEVIAKRAKKRAMHLLEQMDRTEAGLRAKLKQGGYPDVCIDAAIAYVRSYHYLDDSRYAAAFVRYRKERMSRRQLFTKLLSKGISRELARQALEAEYDADESAQIEGLLKKRQFVKEKADSKECRRMYQYLARRGFQSSDILKVLSRP